MNWTTTAEKNSLLALNLIYAELKISFISYISKIKKIYMRRSQCAGRTRCFFRSVILHAIASIKETYKNHIRTVNYVKLPNSNNRKLFFYEFEQFFLRSSTFLRNWRTHAAEGERKNVIYESFHSRNEINHNCLSMMSRKFNIYSALAAEYARYTALCRNAKCLYGSDREYKEFLRAERAIFFTMLII